jgi:hypothetical protein
MSKRVGTFLIGLFLTSVIADGCAGGPASQTPSPTASGIAPTHSAVVPSSHVSPSLAPTASPTPAASSAPSGEFTLVGAMHAVRTGQAAALLNDGRVLLVGGTANKSAEVFDPHTDSFVSTGDMGTARTGGTTATVLTDGKVLVAGGTDASYAMNPESAAELFDPSTRVFEAVGSLREARTSAVAALLPDGSVLIAGGTGSDGLPLATAERYDPSKGTFGAIASMHVARSGPMVATLSDGRILIAGGTDGSSKPLASAEIFDPKTRTFAKVGSMAVGRVDGSAVTLLNGKVLILGGNASMVSESPISQMEEFDPRTSRFETSTALLEGRDGQAAVLLKGGRVLVVGGGRDNKAELLDADSLTPHFTGALHFPRSSLSATRLDDGKVLVAGGVLGSDGVTSAELYWP